MPDLSRLAGRIAVLVTVVLALVLSTLTPVAAVARSASLASGAATAAQDVTPPDPTATISGQVTGPGGNPLDGIVVEAIPAATPDADPVATAITYESGIYDHGGYELDVPAGDFLVRYSSGPDSDDVYETQYHGGGVGSPVTVVDGDTITLDPVSMVPDAGAPVTGTVTDQQGHGLTDLTVLLYNWSSSDRDWYKTAEVTTGTDGKYRFRGVDHGSRHTLRFVGDNSDNDGPSGYADLWYGGAAVRSAAQSFTVPAGAASTPLGTTVMRTGVTAKGTVLDGTTPWQYGSVTLYGKNPATGVFEAIDSTDTGDLGGYRFTSLLPGAVYSVLAEAGGYRNGKADTYLGDKSTLETAGTYTADTATNPATLPPIHVITLATRATGTVTDTAGHGLDRVWVDLMEQTTTNGITSWDDVESTETNSAGQYTFHRLVAGRTYTVFADGYQVGFGTRYLGNTDSQSAATTRPAPATGTLAFPAIALTRAGSTLSGTVALQGGAPIDGDVYATLYRWVPDPGSEEGGSLVDVAWDYSSDSHYVFHDIGAGQYTVGVSYYPAHDAPRLYADGWTGNAGTPTAPDTSPTAYFDVPAPDPAHPADQALGLITLARGTLVHGTLSTTSTLQADGDTWVDVQRWITDTSFPEGGYWDYADADSVRVRNGAYDLVGLTLGDKYRIRPDYSPSGRDDPYLADPQWHEFTPTTPQTTGPALRLVRGVKISGQVVSEGAPLPESLVTLVPWTTGESGPELDYQHELDQTVDRNGHFATYVLPNQTMTGWVYHDGFDTTYYGGGTDVPTAPDDASSFDVGTADVALGDFSLTPQWGSIGTVAGKKLSSCLVHSVYGHTHVSFGPRDGLWISPKGVISDQYLSEVYRPELLQSSGRVALLAPLMDRDLSGDRTTYGISSDGQTLCVQTYNPYDEPGTFSSNTFQTLIAKKAGGGYTVTYDYDTVQTVTDARAGWTDGTDAHHTVFPGSGATGYVDGQPTALTGHTSGADVKLGRYTFDFQGFTDAVDDAPDNAGRPTADGIAAAGQTLTANPGTWYVGRTARTDLHFTYTWVSDAEGVQQTPDTDPYGNVDVLLGSGATHVVSDAEKGGHTWVRVQAVQGSGPQAGFATSRGRAISVGPPAAHNTGAPVVTPTSPRAGQTLSTTNGAWDQLANPADPLTYSYRWYRDGAAIAGETASTYVVRDGDVGRALKVRVTAAHPGNASVPVYSNTVTVQPSPQLTNTTPPTLTGDPAVGKTLVADPGTWNTGGSGTPTFSYKWVVDGRVVSADGGAPDHYTLRSGDAGSYVTVYVTATFPGYTSGLANASSPQVSKADVSFGSITGTVTDGTHGIAGVAWEACEAATYNCVFGSTDSAGSFVTHQAVGTTDGLAYAVTFYAPYNSSYKDTGVTTVVHKGATSALGTVVMGQWAAPPSNVSVPTNNGSYHGSPQVFWSEAQRIVVTGCAGNPSPTYTVTFTDGSPQVHGPMTESPAGTYTAVIPPFYPAHGVATITTNVPATCGGQPTSFDIYIDPSGVVTDQYGRPVDGATVTLLRSDTPNGAYAAVPDGSTIMSADNRKNPSTTGADGYFRWDVTAGYYKVKVAKAGCTPYTTEAMPVPPPAIDLLLKMTCTGGAPAPTSTAVVGGTPAVGKTLTTTMDLWAAPLADSVQWLRDGQPIQGATKPSYVPVATDAGHAISVRHVGQRPTYQQGRGRGVPVTFDATPPSTSTAVKVAKIGSTTTSVLPKKKVSHTKVVTMTVKVAVSGLAPTGRVQVKRGTKVIKTVTMVAASRGVLTLKLGKFRKGRYKMSAVYGGSTEVNPSASKAVLLTVT